MNIAYTGWTWLINHEDNQRWEFEQFLKEVSDLGYDSVENFAFITKFFDDDPTLVKALLNHYGLKMVNLYQHLSEDWNTDIENAVKYLQFMVGIGAKYLNLQGVMWNEPPLNRPTNVDKIKEYADTINRIGKLCRENNCVAVFHPHACTAVYTEEQIDLLMENTDPRNVSLCLDTAHTTLAGMDPVKTFAKYMPRLGYVHLKDVDPDESLHPEWPMKRFCALGTGTIDFKGIVNVIKAGGYDGVLCVELDYPRVCNYHSAMVSRRYLHEVLGL